jgi:hypothetical protein
MGKTTNVPSGPVKEQIHEKFKAFIPEAGIAHDEAMRRLNGMVATFTKEGKFAPKSVGVEYLEARKQVILTLGYRDDEPGYPVKLTSVSLGNLDLRPEQIEEAMSKAAGGVPHVICHEFFVDEKGEFVAVFMSHG